MPWSRGLAGGGLVPEMAVRTALEALDEAGVPHCLRNGELAPSRPGEDIDLLVPHTALARVRQVLVPLGWKELLAPGHHGHEFWVRLAVDGTWSKLDVVTERRYGVSGEPVDDVVARRRLVDGVWVAAEEDEARHRRERAAGNREIPTRWEKLRRNLPLAARRRGVVVAILGPDGAGKGTTIASVRAGLPVATSAVYLGDHRASARDAGRNAGRSTASASAVEPPAPSGPLRAFKEVAFLSRKWLFHQPDIARAYLRAWSGHVVLCDRHPLDSVAVSPQRTPLGGRVERVLATRLTPSPDAVIVLDAPGEVLFARKGEHDPGRLERWRQGYRSLEGAHIVDTTRGVDGTTVAVWGVLWRVLARRRGWGTRA